MRPGLQSPGAITLLAVLIAALLSITPMLCEALTKPEDAPGIESLTDRSVESSIYAMDSVPTICEHAKPPGIAGSGAGQSLISTLKNMDTFWQQVCQITTAFVLSSKKQDTDTIHQLKRRHGDLDPILNSPLQQRQQQQILLEPSHNNDNDNANSNVNNNNSIEPYPTSITISLTSLSDVAAKSSPQPLSPPPPPPSASYSFFSSSPESSPQRPSASQPESAVINASSPVDRKGSYMAILVSLVVAIMWF